MATTNKTAIVTGAGLGIGRGIALALGQAGYNVAASDINQAVAEKVAAEINNIGVKAVAIKCDVSSQSEVKNLFSQVSAEFGPVNVLVNNAGIYPYKPFAQMTEADWDKVMNVNLKSVFFCSQAAAEVMLAKKQFRLIYNREANLKQPNDNAAVTIIAYGLRPGQRNLESEEAAKNIYRGIFKKLPALANDWDMVRSIVYSGAKR